MNNLPFLARINQTQGISLAPSRPAAAPPTAWPTWMRRAPSCHRSFSSRQSPRVTHHGTHFLVWCSLYLVIYWWFLLYHSFLTLLIRPCGTTGLLLLWLCVSCTLFLYYTLGEVCNKIAIYSAGFIFNCIILQKFFVNKRLHCIFILHFGGSMQKISIYSAGFIFNCIILQQNFENE